MKKLWMCCIALILLLGGLYFMQPEIINASQFGNLVSSTSIRAGTYVQIGTFLRLVPATSITVTTDGTITPLGSYQPLTSAGTVQTSAIAAGTAGTVLRLVNTTNTSIVLTDTGTLKLAGNRTLGQYDTLTLVSDGTNWIETAFANN